MRKMSLKNSLAGEICLGEMWKEGTDGRCGTAWGVQLGQGAPMAVILMALPPLAENKLNVLC